MSAAANLADELARTLLDRVSELASLAGPRRRQVREIIREAAENAIDDAIEGVFSDGEPGLPDFVNGAPE